MHHDIDLFIQPKPAFTGLKRKFAINTSIRDATKDLVKIPAIHVIYILSVLIIKNTEYRVLLNDEKN